MYFSKIPVAWRFYAISICLVLLTALISQVYFAKQQRVTFQERLREKVVFFNKAYSFLIADALGRKDDLLLQQVVNSLEQDAEITSIIVVDKEGEIRYHADAQKVGTITDDKWMMDAIKSGDATTHDTQNTGGRAMVLVSPLKGGDTSEAIGCVRIDLTYRFMEAQIARIHGYYFLLILGTVFMSWSITFMLVNRWVLLPIQDLRTSILNIQLSALEANFVETSDEFGKINSAINELILRIKSEWHVQEMDHARRADGERVWVQQLSKAFWAHERVIIADKDNRVLMDTAHEIIHDQSEAPHLLDLISDSNFATLINTAFQTEGEVARGDVVFEDVPYKAGVLSVMPNQSLLVKTIIVLEPHEVISHSAANA